MSEASDAASLLACPICSFGRITCTSMNPPLPDTLSTFVLPVLTRITSPAFKSFTDLPYHSASFLPTSMALRTPLLRLGVHELISDFTTEAGGGGLHVRSHRTEPEVSSTPCTLKRGEPSAHASSRNSDTIQSWSPTRVSLPNSLSNPSSYSMKFPLSVI